jgi:hypothetical protein
MRQNEFWTGSNFAMRKMMKNGHWAFRSCSARRSDLVRGIFSVCCEIQFHSRFTERFLKPVVGAAQWYCLPEVTHVSNPEGATREARKNPTSSLSCAFHASRSWVRLQ